LEIKNFASTFSVLWLSKGTQKMIQPLTFKGQEKSTIRLILKFLVLCDSQLLFEQHDTGFGCEQGQDTSKGAPKGGTPI